MFFLVYETYFWKWDWTYGRRLVVNIKMVIIYVIILKDLSLSFNQSECEMMKSTKSLDRYALLF